MGVPLCARCNTPSYEGEIVVDNKRFSLCGFCLPIVKAKIEGFIEGNLWADGDEQIARPDPNVRNVFTVP